MNVKELNGGVVFTNDNCIGCNKCISGCIALGANVVMENKETETYKVLVDPTKCILCGTCVSACVHKARTYRDDTDAFFDALERGESISILVSPTLLTDYEKQYHNILGYLKSKGVNHIFNTGFGGDLMVWVYMNFIHNFGLSGVISQFCPVIVNYLEKHKPELLPYLMPVQSPLMCTAIYVKDYLKNDDKLAYISPCIASKYEIDDPNTYGTVTYNVTFERLMNRLNGVDISQYYENDEISYGLGALTPILGGLSDNIERYIGYNEVLIQTSGPATIFPYFDHYHKEVTSGSELPFIVEALSCTSGCNFGTGTSVGVELHNEMTFSTHRMKENAYRAGKVSQGSSPEDRLKTLNQLFSEYELSSFVRQYDSLRKIKYPEISSTKINRIFNSMFKNTEEKRHTDCGACGYRTCLAMACAIGMKVNNKENCINYSKECIKKETDKINNLLGEISNMNSELKTATQLKSNFLANMSHEIRTPMNAIIGMAEMALRGDIADEERGYIQQIKSSGRSLLAIINDILDFSKIESGRMELNETEYTSMSIINDTVNIITTRIGEKDITLTVNADPTLPTKLYGDDIRIKQVLVNLANNAVKFTEHGNVNIVINYERISDESIGMNIAVCDTGIGIKKDDLTKLFNSFQQVDSKRNRNVEGTGLGLAISREFVLLMNGDVYVNSEYGKGSIFGFKIPQRIILDTPCAALNTNSELKIACMISNRYVRESLALCLENFKNANITICNSLENMENAYKSGISQLFVDSDLWFSETISLAQKYSNTTTIVITSNNKHVIKETFVKKINAPVYSLTIAAALNNEKIMLFDNDSVEDIKFEAPDAQILIVDDNAINLTVAKGLLSPFKMQITAASGALKAIELIQKSKYDIVFMDHMMPDIDGVEATHIIRDLDDNEGYYKNLPIIALTANAINNAKEMFLREGMNDFVAKPIEMRDITAKLKAWLPQDKIKYLGAETVAAVEDEFIEIAGIDCKSGVALAGSTSLYKIILQDYYDVIDKKSALILSYFQSQNIGSYTIEVHALKSASRLIGATELADHAAFLEKCGHDQNIDPILSETEALISEYLHIKDLLTPYVKHEAACEKTEIDVPTLKNNLEKICIALDDFDIDNASHMTEDLKKLLLDDIGDAFCQKLCDAVDEMEYDNAVEHAKEWLNSL